MIDLMDARRFMSLSTNVLLEIMRDATADPMARAKAASELFQFSFAVLAHEEDEDGEGWKE